MWGARPPTFLKALPGPRGRPDLKNEPKQIWPDCLQVPSKPNARLEIQGAERSNSSPSWTLAREPDRPWHAEHCEHTGPATGTQTPFFVFCVVCLSPATEIRLRARSRKRGPRSNSWARVRWSLNGRPAIGNCGIAKAYDVPVEPGLGIS
jgi:hypothetical protein